MPVPLDRDYCPQHTDPGIAGGVKIGVPELVILRASRTAGLDRVFSGVQNTRKRHFISRLPSRPLRAGCRVGVAPRRKLKARIGRLHSEQHR